MGFRLFIIFFLTASAAADVIHRTDGTSIEGSIKRNGGEWIVTDAAGKATAIPEDQVRSIEITQADGDSSVMSIEKLVTP